MPEMVKIPPFWLLVSTLMKCPTQLDIPNRLEDKTGWKPQAGVDPQMEKYIVIYLPKSRGTINSTKKTEDSS